MWRFLKAKNLLKKKFKITLKDNTGKPIKKAKVTLKLKKIGKKSKKSKKDETPEEESVEPEEESEEKPKKKKTYEKILFEQKADDGCFKP